jgi:hypothetical protein
MTDRRMKWFVLFACVQLAACALAGYAAKPRHVQLTGGSDR